VEKELEVYKLALNKQANRVATLTLDLDLAYVQIDLLTKELDELKKDTSNKKEV
jgi:hypothetical protein